MLELSNLKETLRVSLGHVGLTKSTLVPSGDLSNFGILRADRLATGATLLIFMFKFSQ
jgi:hypothetical protein